MIPLTDSIAYLAADLSFRHGLGMADAIIYATGKDQNAQIVTGDADLKDLPGVLSVRRTHGPVRESLHAAMGALHQ
jgi:predicted nucleic acid-binding protein